MKSNTGDKMVDAIINHLQDESVGIVGQTLFSHFMPAEVTRGLVVVNNLAGAQVDPTIPNYRKSRFRLIGREKNHPSAFALINQAVPKLSIAERQLGEIHVKLMRPEVDPTIFPFSFASNILEVTTTFNIIFAITP